MIPNALIKAKALADRLGVPRFEARAKQDVAELYIYDAIGGGMFGGGITSKDVANALAGMKDAKRLVCYINSPGGDVFDGVAIYNAIRRFDGPKSVVIEGIAASAASIIAMAGDTIEMAHNATMMIHEAWGMGVGNAADLRKTADLLEKITAESVLPSYARTGIPREALRAMMAAETWMSAAEALSMRFCDAVQPAPQIAASVQSQWSASVPFTPGPVTVSASIQASGSVPAQVSAPVPSPPVPPEIIPGPRPVIQIAAHAARKDHKMNPIDTLREKLGKVRDEIKAIEAKAAQELRVDFTTDEMNALSVLHANAAQTQNQIQFHERNQQVDAAVTMPQPRKTLDAAPPQVVPPYSPATGGTLASARFGNWGFTLGLGEYLTAVKNATFGRMDSRLQNAVTTYGQEASGPDGGFAVAPDFATQITSIVTGENTLIDRLNPISTASNQIVFPTDETTPWGTSGIYAEWLGEAATLTPRKPSLKSVTVNLHKVGALVYMSDELQSDAPAIQTHVTRKVATAIASKVNEAIVAGNGSAKPRGFLSCPGLLTTAETATGATTNAADLLLMLASLPPESLANSFWVMHNSILPQIWTLVLGQMPVYTQDLRLSPYGAVLGRPLIISEFCSTANTTGDIILVSPDGYAVAIKASGVESAASIHFAFDQSLMAFRSTMRVGGEGLAQSTITRKNGSAAMSHIITMATRA